MAGIKAAAQDNVPRRRLWDKFQACFWAMVAMISAVPGFLHFWLGKARGSAPGNARRSTTVEDVPYDCMELIMEKLDLVDHYKGWDCLMKPLSMRASPFNTHWFLESFEIFCNDRPSFRQGVSPDSDLAVKGHYCRLLFSEPVLGKEQEICLNLDTKLACGYHREDRVTEDCYAMFRLCPWYAADNGLLVLNLHQNVRSKTNNRHDRFLVLNPVNNSMSVLPPIPDPLCTCKLSNCMCEAVPLKLTVQREQTGGLKTTLSSSYKAYILERKYLPRSLRRNSKDTSSNFRVIAYDSMTKLWQRTGVEWIGNTSFTQIFSMSNETFYVSTGRFRGPDVHETFHDILYKYQDGILRGKVKAPFKLKEEDRYCGASLRFGNPYSCGCISTTVFEDEGKLFFFQQTSWVGAFGPSCISAIIWELNDREMIWQQLYVLHPHRFELCPKRQREFDKIMLTYEGILLVVHGHSDNSDYYLVAGFDLSRKTWCKVPEAILENLHLENLWGDHRFSFDSSGGAVDLDRFLFQPNVSTRA